MASQSSRAGIRLRGVRHNNLKGFDLDLPVGRLIVVTGLSGSGKSSLAFDTLFAEGQRRYIETFSPYARQFFDRMDKPRVDRIEGIPPAIAVEQRNSVRTTRSTVGTMTELCDYMKLLWPRVARLYCRQCGRPVRKESPAAVWETVQSWKTSEVLVTFDLPLSEKLSLEESLSLIAKQGYQRLLIGGEIARVEEAPARWNRAKSESITVVQDRLRPRPDQRARFVEACEQSYHFGKGHLRVWELDAASAGAKKAHPFSNHFNCAACGIEYREPTAALFSFNHPLGACPACRGFGRIIGIDYNLALPDRSKTLEEGVVRPWQTGQGEECQADMMKFCRKRRVPVDVPFYRLSRQWQEWVIQGDPGYGKDAEHRWPRAWYGVAGYFRWLESKAYKMHVRVLLSRYRSYTPCPSCQGQRFQPDSLLFRAALAGETRLSLADFYQMPIRRSLACLEELEGLLSGGPNDPIRLVLQEVRSRLRYLVQVGLGYLTLDRPTRTLSGGETERVNLTTCLGSRLVNTLFVLDEPSVGLHPRDTNRLVQILRDLRDAGNTVLVVEHESSVMRAADQIVDLGPGQGEAGGHVLFQGTFDDLLGEERSLTAQYLNGMRQAPVPADRAVDATTPWLVLEDVSRHNLKNVRVRIPLQRLVCLTGVSGSGKTTLARELLFPALDGLLQSRGKTGPAISSDDPEREESNANAEADAEADAVSEAEGKASGRLSGAEGLSRVVLVDQSPLGRTPRSTPAVYVGAFEDLRQLFAQTELARQRGLEASAFSFNSPQGQCERCRGAGFEKIEMQFLSDVQIRCPECEGRRYRPHVLEVRLAVAAASTAAADPAQAGEVALAGKEDEGATGNAGWSIADLLEAPVDEAMRALLPYRTRPAGERALRSLRQLQAVGLGYLRLGQPINTLSGGESQRLKLASFLAEHELGLGRTKRGGSTATPDRGGTFFIFDEPTTGLHFHDVHVLLKAFQRLVEAGHSLLVIEHHLDVIRSADWIIDLGPEGGEEGGRVVVEGPLAALMACSASHTGQALRQAVGLNETAEGFAGGSDKEWESMAMSH